VKKIAFGIISWRVQSVAVWSSNVNVVPLTQLLISKQHWYKTFGHQMVTLRRTVRLLQWRFRSRHTGSNFRRAHCSFTDEAEARTLQERLSMGKTSGRLQIPKNAQVIRNLRLRLLPRCNRSLTAANYDYQRAVIRCTRVFTSRVYHLYAIDSVHLSDQAIAKLPGSCVEKLWRQTIPQPPNPQLHHQSKGVKRPIRKQFVQQVTPSVHPGNGLWSGICPL